MRLLRELVAAFALLTRLPMPRLRGPSRRPADCVWAYPVVGAVVGAAGRRRALAGLRLGLPQPLAALWALAAITLVTGGLHEDGLADTADGFGGGGTVERKLLIMRDSRIGSFGALALLFSLALRCHRVALCTPGRTAMVLAAVLGAGRDACAARCCCARREPTAWPRRSAASRAAACWPGWRSWRSPGRPPLGRRWRRSWPHWP